MFAKIGNAICENELYNLYTCVKSENVEFFLKKDQHPTYTKIQHLDLPSKFNSLLLNEFSTKNEILFKNTYIKLTKIEGEYKLSVCLKLLGGGGKNILDILSEQPSMTNNEIAILIKEHNIPANTFSSINVSNCEYNFFGEMKESRVISLKPGTNTFTVFLYSCKTFFGGSRKLTETYNSNEIQDLILKGNETESSIKELKRAHEEQRVIRIYFSNDHKSLYTDIEDVKGFCIVC